VDVTHSGKSNIEKKNVAPAAQISAALPRSAKPISLRFVDADHSASPSLLVIYLCINLDNRETWKGQSL
jgi:hypothetical protein